MYENLHFLNSKKFKTKKSNTFLKGWRIYNDTYLFYEFFQPFSFWRIFSIFRNHTQCEYHRNRMATTKCWQPSRLCSRPAMEKFWCEIGTPQTECTRCTKEWRCTPSDVMTHSLSTTTSTTTTSTTTPAAPTTGFFLAWWQIILIATGGGVMAGNFAALWPTDFKFLLQETFTCDDNRICNITFKYKRTGYCYEYEERLCPTLPCFIGNCTKHPVSMPGYCKTITCSQAPPDPPTPGNFNPNIDQYASRIPKMYCMKS